MNRHHIFRHQRTHFGQLGSMFGVHYLSPRLLRSLTAILVGYVAVRLLWQSFASA